jgi:hypothetical protein
MDSPPHILKPLRTILLQTASEEKGDTHLQDFYQESAEYRLRPLSGDWLFSNRVLCTRLQPQRLMH